MTKSFCYSHSTILSKNKRTKCWEKRQQNTEYQLEMTLKKSPILYTFQIYLIAAVCYPDDHIIHNFQFPP